MTTIETRDTGDKYYYKNSTASKSGRSMILSEKYRRLFANKQIVCIEYQDLPDTDEREIFQVGSLSSGCSFKLIASSQRVQLGMALTPAGRC